MIAQGIHTPNISRSGIIQNRIIGKAGSRKPSVFMSKSLRTPQQQLLQDLLINLRKSKNFTQTDIAQKLGRPQSFVAKYEGGERRLDVVEFVDVARVLDADPCEVLASLIQGLASGR